MARHSLKTNSPVFKTYPSCPRSFRGPAGEGTAWPPGSLAVRPAAAIHCFFVTPARPDSGPVSSVVHGPVSVCVPWLVSLRPISMLTSVSVPVLPREHRFICHVSSCADAGHLRSRSWQGSCPHAACSKIESILTCSC